VSNFKEIVKELDSWFWISMMCFAAFIFYGSHNTPHYDIIAILYWVVCMVCLGVANIRSSIELNRSELQKFFLYNAAIVTVEEDRKSNNKED
jgi:hypothetical protein